MGSAVKAKRGVSLGSLAAATSPAALFGGAATAISGIAYDSRAVQPGDLFAALTGADLDGHAFVPAAVARGAAALLVEHRLDSQLPELVVPDTRAALADVAAEFFGHPSRELGVIGITGTDGKTSTSYLVDGLLRGAGHRTGLIGTIAIRVGDVVEKHSTRQTTPESVDIQRYLRAMVETGASWATLEATSHGLAMHRLDGVHFTIAAVTNITHEHLDFHKSLAEYRRAKGILFARVAEAHGRIVVNLDDLGAREMLTYAPQTPCITYSARGDRSADLRAVDVALQADGARFSIEWQGKCFPVNSPLIGGFNVENALCAAGIGLAAGLTLERIAVGLAIAEPIPGRMARIAAGQPFSVVVDYAHTPEALTKVLQLLRDLTPGGRLLVVSGSAGQRDVAKRPLQGSVCARLADVSIFTSEDPRYEDPEAIISQITAGAIAAGGRLGTNVFAITDRRVAIAQAMTLAQPGDCVLLAGKGHEGSIIWGRDQRPWDEAAAAHDALAALGFS